MAGEVVRQCAGAVAGAAVVVLAWVVLVPADAFDQDQQGTPVNGGFAGNSPRIMGILLALVVVGVLLTRVERWPALAVTVGGAVAWVGCFAWSDATAQTRPPSYWPVTLVVLELPSAALGIAIVAGAGLARRARGTG